MSILLTADLHLTDHARDYYRFGLFDWLVGKIRKYNVTSTVILGDLTDRKDRHSSALVNNIVENLVKLVRAGSTVIVLRGNHDAIDPSSPFFEFVTTIPGIEFINEPKVIEAKDSKGRSGKVAWLPHSRDPEIDLTPFLQKIGKVDCCYLHQTFEGAEASNGMQLSGISRDVLKNVKVEAFSGDIHVPQQMGKLTYVGSPYHVHFGDTFEPRVLLLQDDGTRRDLHFKTVKKYKTTITEVKVLHLMTELINEHDQVKIDVKLTRSQMPDWPNMRREVVEFAKNVNWDLCGLTVSVDVPEKSKKKAKSLIADDPEKILKLFSEREKVEATNVAVGLRIINRVMNG